ncbi:MAG: hypothetical protein ACI8TQ_000376 [Planctomycetota bacterium]
MEWHPIRSYYPNFINIPEEILMKSLSRAARAFACAALPAVALTFLTSTTSAQWDDIPHVAGSPVFEDGFIVIHENGSGINAFSAAAQKWSTVSPPGSSLLGFGDWTMLTDEPASGTFRGYSARRNASATILQFNPIMTVVDDDVILVINSGPGGIIAHGYSAVRNVWTSMPLTTIPTAADVAVSRFVIGIRDNDRYHGFAARSATWDSISVPNGGDVPIADGNTVLVNLFDVVGGSGIPRMGAFSGVKGVWSLSPFYEFPPAPQLDHNVAYVRVRSTTPGMFSGSSYSAYDAAWVTSPVLHFATTVTETLTDNVVQIEDTNPAIRYEAFGARPATWSLLAGNFASIVQDEDYTIVRRNSNAEIFGFSGVCGGTWVPEPTPSGALSIPVGTPDHMISLLEGPSLHTFRPAMNTWDPVVVTPASAVITGEDCLTDIRDAGIRGNAGRWPGWVGGPALPAAPFATTSAGSVIAHQQLGGGGVGDIYAFDERCDMFVPPFNPGLVTTLTAARNVIVSSSTLPGSPVHGYSVQRGDWITPGPIPTPLLVPPTADENVAWLVDGTGRLWGFGSPNVGHVYYAWPNGTEYHVSGAPVGTPAGSPLIPTLGYSIKGIPGTTGAFALISPAKVPPFVFVPFLGFVCIDLASFTNLGFFGVTDPDCLRERIKVVPLPLPTCIQLWMQPVSFNFGSGLYTFEHRCDPVWFF